MSSDGFDVPLLERGPTHRQAGGVAVLGGLFAVLVTALAYGPYVGPFARTTPEPMSGARLVIPAQMIAGLLLAVACIGFPHPVRATRNGKIGQYLSAGSFVLASLFPLPALAVLGGGLTSVFLTTGLGYVGVLGLGVGTALLARRLAAAAILTSLEASGVALTLPLGVAGHWLVGRLVTDTLPNPVFGPALFLGPLGLGWVLVGYRIGTLPRGG